MKLQQLKGEFRTTRGDDGVVMNALMLFIEFPFVIVSNEKLISGLKIASTCASKNFFLYDFNTN